MRDGEGGRDGGQRASILHLVHVRAIDTRAGGELDRVVAFRLRSDGVPTDATPFSRTDEQTDSFPNDVAVAMLSAPCE